MSDIDSKDVGNVGIVLPGVRENEHENLMSVGIEEAIKKDGLDTVLLKEEEDIFTPSYLLDMTNVGDIMPSTLEALQTMLSEKGDTAVYMKNGDMVGVIGYGMAYELYNRIDTYVNNVYGGKCAIYKNTGSGFSKIKPMDVDNIILDI